VVYIAEEGLCDIRKLLRQQHIVEGSSALSRAAASNALSRAVARCRGQQRVVEGSSVLSRAGAHDVRETTVVTVTEEDLNYFDLNFRTAAWERWTLKLV
jgi:hypothetical protein